ncbi:gluconolactonase (plasmid) [Phenylobacterium zucineum HLK1]|jgi:sugar lactone lactonase YvrE|uniref:Gluconolactonase n=1 Tax=Phenylobacterium zucineum (strain HLK1) TaxID=450851 RepID=B4RI74_PHEZH|nr:SMP-30/gluconolactonase/LRE family protein [Phenylobacterium zucineum]ACG80049.1 gluconolactonase [Phenylobacterium zucineum HLK1]
MRPVAALVAGTPPCVLGEGPFWDEAGMRLLWVDIVARRVHAYGFRDQALTTWDTPSLVSAAIPTQAGDLMLALQDGLYRFRPETGELRLFCRPDADPGNRSNECRCDPQGRLWLGTMQNNIAPDASPRPVTRSSGGLFVVDADGQSRRMLSNIGVANTLAWSPDGERLYFADSRRNLIWRFRYRPEGPMLLDQEVFVEGGPGVPDGSAMDTGGFLWTARWGAGCVMRYAPDGRIDQIVQLPVRQPSSCAFGGPDRKTLFVTTARHGLQEPAGPHEGCLFSLDVAAPGLPQPIFRG